MEETVRLCMQCEKPIKAGRADKKFCNEGCRSVYHNAKHTAEPPEIRKINKLLSNNREILKSLLGKEEERICVQETLSKRGYKFDYHTHFIITHFKGNQFTFCYDYGYRQLENNKYKIVKSFK
jgi:hypothetical protein